MQVVSVMQSNTFWLNITESFSRGPSQVVVCTRGSSGIGGKQSLQVLNFRISASTLGWSRILLRSSVMERQPKTLELEAFC